jgi:hypothetical protein
MSGHKFTSLELLHTLRLLFLETKNNPLTWNKVKRSNKAHEKLLFTKGDPLAWYRHKVWDKLEFFVQQIPI